MNARKEFPHIRKISPRLPFTTTNAALACIGSDALYLPSTMSCTIQDKPSVISAFIDAGRCLGARVASRAIAPSDAATRQLVDQLDPPAAALWKQRQAVEAERVLSKVGGHLGVAAAIPCALLGVTGLAAMLANPIMLPIGAAMLAVGAIGVAVCGVMSWQSHRHANTADRAARRLDKRLHEEVAKANLCDCKPRLRPPLLRALSQPVMKEVASPVEQMPGRFPGDLALTEMLMG